MKSELSLDPGICARWHILAHKWQLPSPSLFPENNPGVYWGLLEPEEALCGSPMHQAELSWEQKEGRNPFKYREYDSIRDHWPGCHFWPVLRKWALCGTHKNKTWSSPMVVGVGAFIWIPQHSFGSSSLGTLYYMMLLTSEAANGGLSFFQLYSQLCMSLQSYGSSLTKISTWERGFVNNPLCGRKDW